MRDRFASFIVYAAPAIAPLIGILPCQAEVNTNTTVDKIYWAGYYTGIYVKSPNNPSVQQLITTNTAYIYGLAVDPAGGKMYFSDNSAGAPGQGKVRRANLDGTNVETIFPGLDFPQSVALDGAGQVYWADSYRGVIQRANLDGSGVQTLYSGPAAALTIDPLHGMMYWTEFTNNRIGAAQLDGSNAHFIVTQGLDKPRMIDVDPINQHVYWTESGGERIQRANLDGSNVQFLINTDTYETGGIAVDALGGTLYWQQSGQVWGLLKSNLDGSNIQMETSLGISSSSGELALVFIPEPSLSIVFTAFLPLMLASRRRRSSCDSWRS